MSDLLKQLQEKLSITVEKHATINKLFDVYHDTTEDLSYGDPLKRLIEEAKKKNHNELYIEESLYTYYENMGCLKHWEETPEKYIILLEKEQYVKLTQEEKEALEEDEIQWELEDYFFYEYPTNYNLKQLLDNTSKDGLMLLFGTEGYLEDNMTETRWLDLYFFSDKDKHIDVDSLNELQQSELTHLLHQLKGTPLEWFLKTQGFEPLDLFNKDKRQEHPFLQQLLREYRGGLNHMLVALPSLDDLTWEDALGVISKDRPYKLEAGTRFGFFNGIVGTSSQMELTTIKDIDLRDAPVFGLDSPYAKTAVYSLSDMSFSNAEDKRTSKGIKRLEVKGE